jgi:hypothetical protein
VSSLGADGGGQRFYAADVAPAWPRLVQANRTTPATWRAATWPGCGAILEPLTVAEIVDDVVHPDFTCATFNDTLSNWQTASDLGTGKRTEQSAYAPCKQHEP